MICLESRQQGLAIVWLSALHARTLERTCLLDGSAAIQHKGLHTVALFMPIPTSI